MLLKTRPSMDAKILFSRPVNFFSASAVTVVLLLCLRCVEGRQRATHAFRGTSLPSHGHAAELTSHLSLEGLPSPQTIMDFCSQYLPEDFRQQPVLHDSYQEPDSAEMQGSEWSEPRQRNVLYMAGLGQVDGKGSKHSVNLNFEFYERRSADVAWVQAELTFGSLNLSILASPNQEEPEREEQMELLFAASHVQETVVGIMFVDGSNSDKTAPNTCLVACNPDSVSGDAKECPYHILLHVDQVIKTCRSTPKTSAASSIAGGKVTMDKSNRHLNFSVDVWGDQFMYKFSMQEEVEEYCPVAPGPGNPVEWVANRLGWTFPSRLQDLWGTRAEVYGGDALDTDPEDQFYDHHSSVDIESVCIEETTAGLQRMDPDVEMGFLAANADSGVCFSQQHWLGPYRKFGAAPLPPAEDSLSELSSITAESSLAAMSLRLPMRRQMKSDGSVSMSTRTVAAEGVYHVLTGALCMRGCLLSGLGPFKTHMEVAYATAQRWGNGSSRGEEEVGEVDCDVAVHMQLPRHYPWPLINIRAPLRGSIQSLRGEADPLYFPTIEFKRASFRTKEESVAEYERSEAKAILAVVVSSILIACTHKQIRAVKADGQKSRGISLLSLCSLIIGTICTITVSVIDNWFHSAGGFANRGAFRTTTNWSSHAILALRCVETFMLARLLSHVLKARRGSSSGIRDLLGREEINETSEMLLVRDGGEGSTRRSLANKSSNIPASGREPFVWSARTKVLLLLPVVGSLVAYSFYAPILHQLSLQSDYPNDFISSMPHLNLRQSMRAEGMEPFVGSFGNAAVQILGTFGALLLDVFLVPQLLQVIGSEEGSPLHPLFSYGVTVGRVLAHLYEVWARNMMVWVVLEIALYFYLFCEFSNTRLATRIKEWGKQDITPWRFAF